VYLCCFNSGAWCSLKVILGRGEFSYDETRGALYGAVILTVKNGKIVAAPAAY